MPILVINHPHSAPDVHPLRRLRLTIGRSARNDICISDPFASRIHAEVRFENDGYVLSDLDSANGTFYEGGRVVAPVMLAPNGRIRIGETVIELREEIRTQQLNSAPQSNTVIAPRLNPTPETIIEPPGNRTTSGLLDSIQSIEAARASSSATSGAATAPAVSEPESDLLALIGKVGVTLLASATLDETLTQVASLVFDAVPAERCLIMLRRHTELSPREAGGIARQTTEELLATLEVHTAVERTGKASEIQVGNSIIEEVILNGRSVLTQDVQHDPLFRGSTMIMRGIRSVLAVPLGVGREVFGLIYADSPIANANRAVFTENHLKVLTTLASVAAIRVQNTRLLEEHLERERLERELYLAREIQQRFQPLAPPHVEGYDLLGISFSGYEIGGVYYDFIACPDRRLVVSLGDVSGKGTSGALLMSSLHAAIHAQVASQCSPLETVRAVNRYLAANIPANRFVTLFYAMLTPATGELSFANAGHNPPLIARAGGGTEYLDAGGLPLGILADADFQEGHAHLAHGDALVIYSDGVTETQNPDGEEFGVARLEETVVRNLDRTAGGIRDRIEAALTKFADGTASADDITMVIVKRNVEKA